MSSADILIAGLGNIGLEYQNTRHNIGFEIADAIAQDQGVSFKTERLAFFTDFRIKNKKVALIKPTTYMNLSGNAIRYWMNECKIKDPANVLVLLDDLSIDFGKTRIRPSGSDGGHNGLKNINLVLNTKVYPRLRFGIGSNFSRGKQIDYVLGKWNEKENEELAAYIDHAKQACYCFCLEGVQEAMNKFNNK